ncbi:uncharacterized protein LOC106754347 [Vigna radiata var. radiata]|uniref:Uncharacterized protein LOC106754347 n=1 Tax=Vigna radiata var. radiata TaxID=3916 RepID=A0A1S3TDK6_VIGRR|nr:uncharacterized protein LOC106754347 [Vigna radiata var. radiata]
MIENTLNEEEDPLSVGDILGEVYHDLSKLLPSQVPTSVAFAYSHAPTPSNVVSATTNTQLPSPHNIILSNHVASDWVQMSNNSNHLYSDKLKSHHIQYERWTEDEHRLFLLGLIACGEGHWKDISELYIVSKSPSQVASYAQKYKIHQNASTKNKKRKSIHEVSIEPSKHVLPAYMISLDETSFKDDVLNCANHMESYNNSIVVVPHKK